MEPNDEQCILIGNTFANIMQFLVATVAIIVLFIHKIFIEDNIFHLKSRVISCITKKPYPKYNSGRPWSQWILDNTKQGLSSSLAHIYATYVAVLFSHGSDAGDPCAWFLIQFLIDTALGVFISFGLSKLSIFVIGEINQPFKMRWLTIGNYNTLDAKYKYKIWLLQLLHWVICSLLARVFCSVFLLISLPLWQSFAYQFSMPWEHHRNAELVFVVLGMPIIMNSVQFLLTNWYLRWNRPIINNTHLLESINTT